MSRSPHSPSPPAATTTGSWSPPALAAFRFFVIYLSLFALATQLSGSLLPNPFVYYRGLGQLPPLRDMTLWIAEAVFGATLAPADATAGGEPVFFWVQTGWLLVLAIVLWAVWTMRDRRRREYNRLHAWMRVVFRFVLAAAMFEYGMTKVIPTQFPRPSLTALVTPLGDLTLSAALWSVIGASPAYQVATGCIEVLGAVLLVVPRTALLGAAVSLAAALHVFLLNMTFDIGLKLVSFHLVLLALFLLAPDAQRLLDLLVRNRAAAPRTEVPLARTPQGERRLLVAQIAVGVALLVAYAAINVQFWNVGGGGRPLPPLHGVWGVEGMQVDGERRPVESYDYDRRWRRLIVDAPGTLVLQRTDDSFARYGLALDEGARTLTLTKGGSRTWRAHFRYERPSPGALRLAGTMDGMGVEAELRLIEPDTWRLLNSSFRWVRPHDSPQ